MSSPVKNEGPSLARSAGLVSLMVSVSRVLGLVREQVFAALLGAGLYADAFQIAFRIPNLLRDLFAEGALSAAFVPTYAAVAQKQGLAAAHRLGSRLMTLLAVILTALVVAGGIWAEALVGLIAPGFDKVAGKAEVAVSLTRVMLPFLPLISFAAVAMGMLNARGRFGVPAIAPAAFNLATILVGLGIWAAGLGAEKAALGWAIGTLLGGAAQLVVQWPALRAEGFRFQPEWRPGDPGIRRIGSLMAPATVGLAAVQINLFASSIFASETPGAVAWLNYGFRLLYLPIGIFGVAIATIAASGLARKAAEGDLHGLGQTLRQSLRLLMFLTIPATVGLVVLREPIVRLIYERGRFGPDDTRAVALGLLFYSIGLVGHTAVKVLAPAFYAVGSPRVPLLASLSAVATNLLLLLLAYSRLGFVAVALGMSLGAFANAGILLVVFERRHGGLRRQGLGSAALRMALASLCMGLVAFAVTWGLEHELGTAGLWARLAGTLGGIGAGVIAYGLAVRLLGLPEWGQVAGFVKRRLRPTP